MRQPCASGHRRAADRGATRANVLTQLDNAPTYRLRERCGYRLAVVKYYYHLWSLESRR